MEFMGDKKKNRNAATVAISRNAPDDDKEGVGGWIR